MYSVVVPVDALEGDVSLARRAPDDDGGVFRARRQKKLSLGMVGKTCDRGVTLRGGQDVHAVGRRAGNNAQRIDSPKKIKNFKK